LTTELQINPLSDVLAAADVPQNLIDAVTDSGYYMRGWVDPFSGKTWQSVSDMMYGNKQFSSHFATEDFIKYIKGEYSFPALPPLRSYDVSSIGEIREILADPCRARYIKEGSFTFRGQPKEYRYKRRIPSPVRSDSDGYEISVLPGAYRQTGEFYSFAQPHHEHRSFERLLAKLEPNNSDVFIDQSYAFDIMRTEQHYATQTAGLDLAFELDTAVFFATHRFRFNAMGQAYYEAVPTGEHSGVIYGFRFCDPLVKSTQYLIEDFDLFKTYPPLRIIRQDCGLPLFMPDERNIALIDIDCIIRLTPHFSLPDIFRKQPEFMFPSAAEDKFYGRLLELKDENPELLKNVVEYVWARR
jgi:hypothetical protein